ncbi:hypothetical protein PsYK624_075330 [Phanerochaete sordida]|uniref:Uncharacterized protein n=1 Tax=Phanerochaete sordida TaxID=48140 RepID=A0A9P3G8M7_9APHY|nr:hypothetical protein PsYK624_075330 [Phanerochaete sordida]
MSSLRALQRPLRSLTHRRLCAYTCRAGLVNNEPTWARAALRQLQTSAVRRDEQHPPPAPASPSPRADSAEPAEQDYEGPLAQTFRRLKIFSVSSLALSTAMTPFIFMIETTSAVPIVARVALAGTVLMTSGVSTALVAWCGRPYVTRLHWFHPEDASATPSKAAGKAPTGMELVTATLTLRKRITRVYDTAFLVPTSRPFAKWELAEAFQLPPAEAAAEKAKGNLPREETIAETLDESRQVVGRWIVSWDENGSGTCRQMGKIQRYFNVHEELLPRPLR